MVEQQNGSAYTEILYSPLGKTAIMSGATVTKAFAYLPGGGTAIYNSSGLAYYRHSDWLGSSRLTSSQARGMYSSSAYAPFGEQYDLSGTSDASFTSHNADTASTLYDFTFREHSPSQGRWLSPDPAGLVAVDPTNPQTWNRYAYVGNTPLSQTDPLGLDDCPPDTICVTTWGWADIDPSLLLFAVGGGGPHFAPLIDQSGGGGGANNGKKCISPSTLRNLAATPEFGGLYAAYLASRAGAWLSGGTVGVGWGGSAGFGLGPSGTVAVGASVSGSLVFSTDGLGNSALAISFTPPVQLSAMSTNPNWFDAGGAAIGGLQVTASSSLVPTTIKFSASPDINGSVGPVGFDWTPDSVSLLFGPGVGARVGGSVGGSLSLSIPICKK